MYTGKLLFRRKKIDTYIHRCTIYHYCINDRINNCPIRGENMYGAIKSYSYILKKKKQLLFFPIFSFSLISPCLSYFHDFPCRELNIRIISHKRHFSLLVARAYTYANACERSLYYTRGTRTFNEFILQEVTKRCYSLLAINSTCTH